MQMNNIYLVRHAQSQSNIDFKVNRSTPTHLIELSERGQEQAQEAAIFLARYCYDTFEDYPLILSSPYKRARQTSEIIFDQFNVGSKKTYKVIEYPNLVEQQFGLFDGLSEEERIEQFAKEHHTHKRRGWFFGKYPQGESQMDVYFRVQNLLNHLEMFNKCTTSNGVIIVSHGITIRCLTMALCNYSYEWIEQEKNPKNASVRLIAGHNDRGYIFDGFDE